jgi:hypothetical protein
MLAADLYTAVDPGCWELRELHSSPPQVLSATSRHDECGSLLRVQHAPAVIRRPRAQRP